MDPESGSGGANWENAAKAIRPRFCWVPGDSLKLRIQRHRRAIDKVRAGRPQSHREEQQAISSPRRQLRFSRMFPRAIYALRRRARGGTSTEQEGCFELRN